MKSMNSIQIQYRGGYSVGPTVSSHRFWANQTTHWTGGLQSGGLQYGGLQSGGLQSRATDFGPGGPLTRSKEKI